MEYNVILNNKILGTIFTNRPIELEEIIYFSWKNNYCVIEMCGNDLIVVIPNYLELTAKLANGNFRHMHWWRENNV